jgi:hypothetical protein
MSMKAISAETMNAMEVLSILAHAIQIPYKSLPLGLPFRKVCTLMCVFQFDLSVDNISQGTDLAG